MTQDQAPEPPHALPAMTTSELKDYRKQLEHALKDRVIGNAPVAARLKAKLQLVLDEEADREKIRQTQPPRKWPW